MDKATALPRPAAAISTTAARLSFAAAVFFVALLASLHVIKPDIDPSWHFISEYAIGDYGWVMPLAFLALALSYAALFAAVRSQTRTFPGRIGLALLLVSAAGLIIGAIFTTDPITARPEDLTTAGHLHNLGGTLGLAMPLAAVLVSLSLARNPAWAPVRRSLLWAAGLAVAGFLISFVALGFLLAQSGGQFGPSVPVGWPNRLEVLAYSAWLMLVARGAAGVKRVRKQATKGVKAMNSTIVRAGRPGRFGSQAAAALFAMVIFGLYGTFLPFGLAGILGFALIGLPWARLMGVIANRLARRAAWQVRLANAPLLISIIAAGLLAGGGLMYIFMMRAVIAEPSTTYAALSALMQPAVPYYIVINTLLELFVMLFIIFFNWNAGPRRRLFSLTGVGLYLAMRVWTYLVYAETRLEITTHTLSTADVEWFHNTLASDYRAVMELVAQVFFSLAAFTSVRPARGADEPAKIIRMPGI